VRLVGVVVEAAELTVCGDEPFDAVYDAHYPSLVRLAYLTTGNLPAAEDVVQDVFIEWYKRRDDVRQPVAYLRRAVVSRCTSWVRRRSLERRHGASIGFAAYAGSMAVGAPNADAPAVREALSRLKPRQRAAVFLRYYLDLPVAEIAAALGCRPGTVKSLLHRSLAVLKEQLDER
jgi:RNA polymerase sigma-70 factor (sigma-E family)